MTLNYSLWSALGPTSLPFWLLLIGAALLPVRRSRWGRRLIGAGLALFVVLGLLPTGFWLMRPLEMRYAAPDLDQITPRAIVVLAGGEDLPASALRGAPEFTHASERLLTGITLARRYPEAELYLVGGISLPDGTTDTDLMLQTALDLGLPRRQIKIISSTRNTCENARATVTRLGREDLSRSLLITSAFHLPRAMLCFEAVNSTLIPVPVDYRTWVLEGPTSTFRLAPVANLLLADLALHEWAGLLYYRATGRTLRLWPAD